MASEVMNTPETGGNRLVVVQGVRRVFPPKMVDGETVHVVRRRTIGQRLQSAAAVILRCVRPLARRTESSSYWYDKGWVRKGDCLYGHYNAGGRRYRGKIELRNSTVRPFKFYVYDPPGSFLTGPHSACFHRQGKECGRRRYWMHMRREPRDLGSGIAYIESELAKAS